MPLTICVVIVTKDRKDDVMRLTGSLSRQTRAPDKMVLVDSSDDPVTKDPICDLLKCDRGRVEIIPGKCTLPEGRNRGLDAADCDLVSFIDDDTVLERDYFDVVARFFEADDKRAVAGVEGEITNLPVGRLGRESAIHALNAMFFLSYPGRGMFRLSGTSRPLQRSSGPAAVSVLSGANMTFRRDVLMRFRFDEGLRGGRFREDLDVSARLSKEFMLYHLPRARLEHLVTQSARPTSTAAVVSDLRNQRRLFQKNFDTGPKSRLAFRISVLGLFLHLFVDRHVDAIGPFLKELSEGDRGPSGH